MQQIFDKIPDSSVEYVKGLIFSEKIIFKLKKSRKTKTKGQCRKEFYATQ